MQPGIDVFLFRLLLVLITSGLIGAEREYRSKSAGFRTIILIGIGSFLFSIMSIYVGSDRIAANVATGIGFIGAGVILQNDSRVTGLTTAATIWTTAAVAMGIAFGYYIVAVIAALMILASLFWFIRLEDSIDRANQTRKYRILSVYQEDLLTKYEQAMTNCGLKYKVAARTKQTQYITGVWTVSGKEKDHEEFVRQMLHDDTVKEFDF
jgi:putative Mg2+ transporter-C (MgtC) family protein